MKSIFKAYGLIALFAAIGFLALPLTGCSSDDGGGGDNTPDYDMTGTYTFNNRSGECTWIFNSDGTYECSGAALLVTKTGTWKSKGNDVTISFYNSSGSVTASGEEVFTVQANGNQVTLTLKDNSAQTSNVLVNFILVAKSVTLTKTNSSTIKMVSIPGGTFTMGSPTNEPNRINDETQHSVTLTGFKIGKYQVTQEQYVAVMGRNPSSFTSAVTGENGTPGKLPVELVSWYDALVFCNKLSIKEGLIPAYRISGSTDPAVWGTVPTSSNSLWDAVEVVSDSTGYRLPTEAQWEYACRAGTTTAYNTGATISDSTGWYNSNSGSKTHQVGLNSANAWGLYDMHGNVCEWCLDWYGSYSGTQTDPLGASSGSHRVFRGGSWSYAAEDLRSAYRNHYYPYYRYNNLGFRLVRP